MREDLFELGLLRVSIQAKIAETHERIAELAKLQQTAMRNTIFFRGAARQPISIGGGGPRAMTNWHGARENFARAEVWMAEEREGLARLYVALRRCDQEFNEAAISHPL